MVLQPRGCIATAAVWALPRSLATTGGIIVIFSSWFLEVLRCFSSLRLPPYTYIGITTLQVAGLSHSEIAGSEVICTYPALIAAYHVLHRLREPRHPPSALYYFLFAIVHTFSCHAVTTVPLRERTARQNRIV